MNRLKFKTIVNILELEKNIIVYKNIIKNPESIIKSINLEKEWSSWYTFGEITQLKINEKRFVNFPSIDEWTLHVKEDSSLLDVENEIINAYYSCTSDYVTRTNIKLDNWFFFAPQICRYFDNAGVDKDAGLAMNFHTDFQKENKDEPGKQHMITCNIYLNDNYDGGEIVFKIFNEDSTYSQISYKPEAGDIVIFPSTEPYYHGVNTSSNGLKYFVRSFWYKYFEGTEEWHNNKEKYGEDVWFKMEQERKAIERKDGRYHKNY